MRGFASMPDAALQRDSQHYTGRVTQSGRGFASSSEPAQQSAAPAAESAQQPFIPPGRIHNAPAPPWTPTRELRKRNFLPRRMGHLMEVLDREAQEKAAEEKKFPDFEAGDLLELTLGVPENKGREAKVRGICMAKRRRGYRTSFTLLNHIPGGGPVERSFPLYSPTLQSIKVLGRRKVRRAKLYYLRNRKPSEYKV
ncbi:g10074 [Coccomyxa viridis]|uniref:G10074 protein n=1 Tax=Coccomyxa viridis TaxID=1274662 RepID=A0ABP1G758_9CHLO